jgi:hypothetical protein
MPDGCCGGNLLVVNLEATHDSGVRSGLGQLRQDVGVEEIA